MRRRSVKFARHWSGNFPRASCSRISIDPDGQHRAGSDPLAGLHAERPRQLRRDRVRDWLCAPTLAYTLPNRDARAVKPRP